MANDFSPIVISLHYRKMTAWLYLALHDNAVLQTACVGGMSALPFGERHRSPVTPLEIEVSLQVVQTQP